jgi:hypothetical protein
MSIPWDTPFWQAVLANPAIPLSMHEEPKKALTLIAQGIPAIAVRGLTMWRLKGTDATKAEFEYRNDKPYQDNNTMHVAEPFAVQSLLPRYLLVVNANEELIAPNPADFSQNLLEPLGVAGVPQTYSHFRRKCDTF